MSAAHKREYWPILLVPVHWNLFQKWKPQKCTPTVIFTVFLFTIFLQNVSASCHLVGRYISFSYKTRVLYEKVMYPPWRWQLAETCWRKIVNTNIVNITDVVNLVSSDCCLLWNQSGSLFILMSSPCCTMIDKSDRVWYVRAREGIVQKTCLSLTRDIIHRIFYNGRGRWS
jgi:hypothetical protein